MNHVECRQVVKTCLSLVDTVGQEIVIFKTVLLNTHQFALTLLFLCMSLGWVGAPSLQAHTSTLQTVCELLPLIYPPNTLIHTVLISQGTLKHLLDTPLIHKSISLSFISLQELWEEVVVQEANNNNNVFKLCVLCL